MVLSGRLDGFQAGSGLIKAVWPEVYQNLYSVLNETRPRGGWGAWGGVYDAMLGCAHFDNLLIYHFTRAQIEPFLDCYSDKVCIFFVGII